MDLNSASMPRDGELQELTAMISGEEQKVCFLRKHINFLSKVLSLLSTGSGSWMQYENCLSLVYLGCGCGQECHFAHKRGTTGTD